MNEEDQVDTLNVFNGDSPAHDVGVLTDSTLTGFGMGTGLTLAGRTFSGGITYSNGKGLKKIAPLAGHRWRDDEAGGEASMSWYREAVGYEGSPDPSQRQRLLEYNEDDVIATKILREWMTDRAVQEIPHIDDL